MSFNNIGSVSVKGNGYRIRFCYMSKEKAKYLLKKCWLDWKKWNIINSKMDKKL